MKQADYIQITNNTYKGSHCALITVFTVTNPNWKTIIYSFCLFLQTIMCDRNV